MNISIKMLKIVTIILWIIIVFFSVTAVISAMNLGIIIGEVQIFPSGNGITFSLPFSISNDGFYEIVDLNLTTRVTDPDGIVLDLSETVISSIPPGTNVSESHKVTIDINDMLSMNQESLLLKDSNFMVELFSVLDFAKVVPVQLSTNTSIPWGAPFAQLSIGQFAVSPHNTTHVEAKIPISFENHAILDIFGTLIVEVYDNSIEQIASEKTLINVPSGYSYSENASFFVKEQDVSTLTNSGILHMIFETPMFTVDWDEQYG